jgi:hypothetical protein
MRFRRMAFWMAGVIAACGPSPEQVGDECDPDDGCPDGLVCASRGDEDICLHPPGAACDPNQDFCHESECLDNGEGGFVCAQIIEEGGSCDPNQPDVSICAPGLVCAELAAGGHACFAPVLLRGQVFDAQSLAPIAEAQVLALDDQGTAVSDVATSDAAGNYELDLPVARSSDGAPVADAIFTLRGSAADYQTFPGGVRTSLPISSGEIAAEGEGWVLDTTLTDIGLIALPQAERGLPSIAGHVLAGDASGGVLVVAENGERALTAVSDRQGAYTIFNVPDGAFEVRGYAAGVQLEPANAEMAGAPLVGVDLALGDAALGSVSGSVNIVNAPGGSVTSVVLVVASTFNPNFVRGEVGRGLRTPLSGPPNVSGQFEIAGVPEGDYLVLAAFENDFLVRDPDPNIAGTQIQSISMPARGEDVSLEESFKITEALAVVGPGAEQPEEVSSAPTLTWADDSSEDYYTVVVYDALGERVWCLSDDEAGCDGPNVPRVTGSDDVEVEYGGPLAPGMYYQFRATSWRNTGPISQTEDLRGVFFVAGGR